MEECDVCGRPTATCQCGNIPHIDPDTGLPSNDMTPDEEPA